MSGWVNFPVYRHKSTGEGGMFVVLFVPDVSGSDGLSGWSQCCGPNAYMILGECFIGSDVMPAEVGWKDYPKNHKDLDAWEAKHYKPKRFYFPNADTRNKRMNGYEKYLSQHALAVVNIGSTGWSGWNEETDSCWRCSFDDLTMLGKELYNNLWRLYGVRPHILTFLDT